jgi:hypothetical protein
VQPGGQGGGGSGDPSNGSSPTAQPQEGACGAQTLPPGAIAWQREIVGGAHVAVTAAGEVAYTTDPGVVALDAAGSRLFAFPHGDVVATDAAGDVFVAGVFTQPIDIGGRTLEPTNGNDVFIVKLSPSGDILFVQQGLCTANIMPGVNTLTSIAVAADGRIALAGMTFGAVVLDATGELIFQAPFARDVAFDSTGDLVIGFTFGGSGSLELAPGVVLQGSPDFGTIAIEKLDAAGSYVSHVTLAGASIDGLAVDAKDHIAFIGEFVGTMTLYGQALREPVALPFPAGTQFGSIAVVLDASYQKVWAEEINPFNSTFAVGGLALNQLGDVIVSSNFPETIAAPYSVPTLAQYSAGAGGVLLSEGARANGFGLGVAADACAGIYVATVQYTPLATTLLQKIIGER